MGCTRYTHKGVQYVHDIGTMQDKGYSSRFQPNRPSSFRDTKNGCVCAHVQWHLKFKVCIITSCGIPDCVQNFSPIGPVVSEIQKRGVHVRTCNGT